MIFRHLMSAAVSAAALVAVLGSSAAATDVKVGGVAVVKPTYEGSDSYEVIGAPIAFPAEGAGTAGSFTFNGVDDLRYRLLGGPTGFEAGPLAGYAFGRDDGDGPLLRGLGDVDGGVIVGGYAGYRAAGWLFDVSYHHIVSGDTGGFLRLGVANKTHHSDRFWTKLRVAATYADDDYMSHYFGVSAAQSAASLAGLPLYDADAGFKDVHVVLSGSYDIARNWSVIGSAGYKRLIGDAADSPVVESEDQFTATLGLTYRFSTGNR
jgi:outer membrane scaffolding protein for murein synthesis (MipA/OmpV family)